MTESVKKFVRIVLDTYRRLYGTSDEKLRRCKFLRLQLAREAKALDEGFEGNNYDLREYLAELERVLKIV